MTDRADEIAREILSGWTTDPDPEGLIMLEIAAALRSYRNEGLEGFYSIMKRWPDLRIVTSSDVPQWAQEHGSNVVVVISGPFTDFGNEPADELAAIFRRSLKSKEPQG